MDYAALARFLGEGYYVGGHLGPIYDAKTDTPHTDGGLLLALLNRAAEKGLRPTLDGMGSGWRCWFVIDLNDISSDAPTPLEAICKAIEALNG